MGRKNNINLFHSKLRFALRHVAPPHTFSTRMEYARTEHIGALGARRSKTQTHSRFLGPPKKKNPGPDAHDQAVRQSRHQALSAKCYVTRVFWPSSKAYSPYTGLLLCKSLPKKSQDS